MTLAAHLSRTYRFGRYLLEPERRLLSLDGVPVPLGSRAFDILQLLVERRDVIVSRDEMLAEVWRGTVVEGNTLAVQISALRRALGDMQVIATVPGRGYRFVATVQDEIVVHAEVPALPSSAVIPDHLSAFAVAQAARPTMLSAFGRNRLGWIATAALTLMAAGAFGLWHLGTVHEAPRLSIVVLPFRNLGSDPEQNYLADAISDDLTTDLSHIPGSVVIARASADTYRARAVAADAIGRALNVRYLLEGSLRAEGDTLHINAQLIDAPTGSHLWASAFDVERPRLGSARTDIVRHIASALHVTLVAVEGARSLTDANRKPDAMDFYLRARSVLDHASQLSDYAHAQALLEKAIAASPDFTEALTALGQLLLEKVSGFDDPDEKPDHARAAQVIARSLSIKPGDPDAVVAQGYLAWVDGKCGAAEPAFREALLLDTNNVIARSGLARCAKELGHMQEMIDDLAELMRIDPVGPEVSWRYYMIGTGHLMLGRPAEAVLWLERAGSETNNQTDGTTELDWHEWCRVRLIAANEMAGNHELAARQYSQYSNTYQHRTVWRLATYNTHAESKLKDYAPYLAALHRAGMPMYAEENKDFGVSEPFSARNGGDFDPTPLNSPAGKRISTAFLKAMISSASRPVIIDVGRGAGCIEGAIWLGSQDVTDEEARNFGRINLQAIVAPNQPLVVMSDGTFGWTGYNTALQLAARLGRQVLWYRGGEEAWVAQGLASEDKRSP